MGPLSFGPVLCLLLARGLAEGLAALEGCLKGMELDTLRVVALIEADIARTRLILTRNSAVRRVDLSCTTLQRSTNRGGLKSKVSFLYALYTLSFHHQYKCYTYVSQFLFSANLLSFIQAFA